jgi:urease accessory protein
MLATTIMASTVTPAIAMPGMATSTAEPVQPNGAGALGLVWWLSPGFPVGAYAYSHALEWAAEAGDLASEAACAGWIGSVMLEGAGRNDAILLRAAHAAPDDPAALASVNELALALAPSGELRLETAQQGRSFLDAMLQAFPNSALTQAAGGIGEIAYPVAVGLGAACHRVPVDVTVRAFLAAFAQNLVSAALRLAPIGQNAGLRILSGLAPELATLAAEVLHLGLDSIASATIRADLGSFRHETQYTRLFRS